MCFTKHKNVCTAFPYTNMEATSQPCQELVCLIGIPVTAASALVRDWDMTGAVCHVAGFLMTTLGQSIASFSSESNSRNSRPVSESGNHISHV